MADSVITMPLPYATIQHWHGSDGHASTVSNALLRITDLPFVTGLWGGTLLLDFPGGSDGKASVYNVGDLGSIPGSGRSPGEGNGNPLQYSCLENPMDRVRESVPRQVDRESRGPQGERGLEFSRRKKGQAFFFFFSPHSLGLYNNNVSCLRTVFGFNLLLS